MKKRSVTPKARRRSLSSPDLSPSTTAHPSSPGEALELTDTQAKQAISVSEMLGAATGVGDNKYVATRIFSQFNAILPSGTDPRTTLFLLAELQPKNILEAMLITQMVGTHEAALAFLKTSTTEEPSEFRDQNVARSTRLMRLFMEQLEQLQRLRGATNQQKVTVEHVHVNAGGQAIVGAVVPPPAALSSAEPTEKLLPGLAVKKRTDG